LNENHLPKKKVEKLSLLDKILNTESVMDGYSKIIVVAILLMAPAIEASADATEDIRRADELYAASEFEASVKFLSQAIDSGELSGEALATIYFKRGLTYGRYSKNDEAISDYEIAIIFDPTHVAAWSSICYQKSVHQEKLDEALSACNQALRLDSNHGPSYGLRGYIWRQKGNFAEGEKDYNHAVLLSPDNWLIRFNRGHFYDHFDERNKALRDLTEAYEMAPSWGRTHSTTLYLFKEYGIVN
jgi:tetratricopeptide (TPR) repeat protein